MRFSRTLLCNAALLGATLAHARDGDFDIGFGFLGKDRIAVAGSSYVFHGGAALAVQPDGNLLIAGTKYTLANNLYDYDMVVMRLQPNGLPDATFGTNGEVDVPFNRAGGNNDDDVSDMVLQGDGRVVLVGSAAGDPTTGVDIAAVRLKPNGAIDTSYGNSGKSLVPFNLGGAGHVDDQATAAALDSQGRLLIAGYADTTASMTSSSALVLVRLDTSGNRDTTFSSDGRVIYTPPAGKTALPYRVRELASHKILVVGALLDNASQNADFLLQRYLSDGSPDLTFGTGGSATFGFDIGGSLLDLASDFAELPDGALLVSGVAMVNAPYNTDAALMKFTADGAPFPGFAPRTYPLDLGGNFQDVINRMMLDGQGRIVMAGTASTGVVNGANLTDFVVLRALPDGSLDPGFGTNGRIVRSSAVLFQQDLENSGTALAFDAQQHIVIAGTSAYTAADTYKHQFAALRVIGDTVFGDGFGP